jgi:enoyl-CoA hydratase/carnithine racemase
MGMGIVFAAATDYSLGVSGAIWQMPEINAGIFPGASCIPIMVRVCGVAWTRRILMLGEPFGTPEALAAHIIDEVVDPTDLPKRLQAVAKALKRKNGTALQAVKFAVAAATDLGYVPTTKLENNLATWYEWDSPMEHFEALRYQYRFQLQLLGLPAALAIEWATVADADAP